MLNDLLLGEAEADYKTKEFVLTDAAKTLVSRLTGGGVMSESAISSFSSNSGGGAPLACCVSPAAVEAALPLLADKKTKLHAQPSPAAAAAAVAEAAAAENGECVDNDSERSPWHVPSERMTAVLQTFTDVCNVSRLSGGQCKSVGWYPRIATVADHFTLNAEQYQAFILVAVAILKSVVKRVSGLQLSDDAQSALRMARECVRRVTLHEQMIGYIAGEAGTGKSQVINAIVLFAQKWRISECLLLTSTTGASAALLRANTYHSALGIVLSKFKTPEGEALALRHKEWAQVDVLIIDEIGMCGARALDLINTATQCMKDRTDTAFGGLNVFMFGDFFQLNPVGDSPMWKQPGATSKSGALHGFEIFRKSLNVGVRLRLNMRALKDPDWAAVNCNMSVNAPLATDLSRINARLISSTLRAPADAIVCAPTNAERTVVNEHRTTQKCRERAILLTTPAIPPWRRRGVIRILTDVERTNQSKKDTALSDEQTLSVRWGLRQRMLNPMATDINTKKKKQKSKNKVDVYDGWSTYVIGCPVIVLENQNVNRGIANGASAVFRDLALEDETAVWFVRDSLENGGGVHHTLASNVRAMILEYKDERWIEAHPFPPLPAQLFPLKPRSMKIQLKEQAYTISQLPCAPGYALTCDKMQGRTMGPIVVASWNMKRSGHAYVATSRVTTAQDFFILEKISTDLANYKPRSDIILESMRLDQGVFRATTERLVKLGAPAPPTRPPLFHSPLPSAVDSAGLLKDSKERGSEGKESKGGNGEAGAPPPAPPPGQNQSWVSFTSTSNVRYELKGSHRANIANAQSDIDGFSIEYVAAWLRHHNPTFTLPQSVFRFGGFVRKFPPLAASTVSEPIGDFIQPFHIGGNHWITFQRRGICRTLFCVCVCACAKSPCVSVCGRE